MGWKDELGLQATHWNSQLTLSVNPDLNQKLNIAETLHVSFLANRWLNSLLINKKVTKNRVGSFAQRQTHVMLTPKIATLS